MNFSANNDALSIKKQTLELLIKRKEEIKKRAGLLILQMLPNIRRCINDYYVTLNSNVPVWIQESTSGIKLSVFNLKEAVQKYLNEIITQIKEKAENDIDSWSTNFLCPLLTYEVERMIDSLEISIGGFFNELDSVTECCGGTNKHFTLWQRAMNDDEVLGRFGDVYAKLLSVQMTAQLGLSVQMRLAITSILPAVFIGGIIMGVSMNVFEKKIKDSIAKFLLNQIRESSVDTTENMMSIFSDKLTEITETIVNSLEKELVEAQNMILLMEQEQAQPVTEPHIEDEKEDDLFPSDITNNKDVLFLGAFAAGKRTIINALLNCEFPGSDTPLVWASLPSVQRDICILQTQENEYVEIYYKSNPVPKRMNLLEFEEFSQKYQFSHGPEAFYLLECRANEIDRILFYINNPILKTDIRLIRATYERAKALGVPIKNTGLKLVPKAAAIIYVLNSCELFSSSDYKAIEYYFNVENKENYFFLMNKANMLRDSYKNRVEEFALLKIKQLFGDNEELFDMEWYNRRVFLIDALDAFEAKQKGDLVALHKSGFMFFESALFEYLNGWK